MPLRLVSRSFWKNSANDRPDWVSMTFGKSSPPKQRLLRCSVVGQVQQHRLEGIEIDIVGVPAGVEVAGFVLGGDQAALQPDPPATGVGEQFDRFSETVEQASAAFGPPEPLNHLVPRRDMLTRWQPAAVGVERRKHTTTLSLCSGLGCPGNDQAADRGLSRSTAEFHCGESTRLLRLFTRTIWG